MTVAVEGTIGGARQEVLWDFPQVVRTYRMQSAWERAVCLAGKKDK